MKSLVSFVCLGMLFAVLVMEAHAQTTIEAYPPEGYSATGTFVDGQSTAGSVPAGYHSGSSGQYAADVPNLLPGRLWVEMNLADNGLGYSGTFGTIGYKRRLFQDFLDGRWLLEGQGHLSLQSGGLFGNIGIERVFTVDSAPADVAFSVWYDYDDSGVAAFTHTLNQVGVSGSIRTKRFDIRANGYFPVGTSDYAQGDPTGADCFLGNHIVLTPGIDSGLQGFDAEVRLRPYWLSMLNGTLDLGGYAYDSDLVDHFGGVRARVGVQTLRGGIVSLEVNHDDRFDTTGVLQLGWHFGGHGGTGGHEYSPIGRDLDKTIRNAHIVRYSQDLELAINPVTGRPYRVHHVDNTAGAGGDGTVESRFDSLADAETASRNNDIIFVYEGDGSTTNYDTGIVLKNGQFLLGDGVQHLLPIQDGRIFSLCSTIDGVVPTITNRSGTSAITMANNNVIRGIDIVGNSSMVQGIHAANKANGTIDTVNISGGTQFDGILLDNIRGDWELTNVNVSEAGRDGLHVQNVTPTNFRLTLNQGSYSNNLRDGIHIENFDGRVYRMIGTRTDNNIRHGVFMHDHIGAGSLTTIDFRQHKSNGNGVDGIFLQNVDGDIQFLNPEIATNAANGIHLLDVTNSSGGTTTRIIDGVLTGNGIGAGAGVNNRLTAGTQRLRITGSQIDNNGFGIIARAENLGTSLDTQVLNNVSISNNIADGARFVAVGGAIHNVRVENRNQALNMLNNGTATGNGISLIVGDPSASTSSMDVVIRNVNLTGSGDAGIFGIVDRNGQLTSLIENNTIANSGGDGMQFIFNATNLVLQEITSINNTVTGNGDDGLDIDTNFRTLADIFVSPSTFTNNGGNGIELVSTAQSKAQLYLDGSTVSNNGANGLFHSLTGSTEGLVYLRSTQFAGNATDGIRSIASGSSILSTRVENISATGNGGQDADIDTLQTGTYNGLFIGNTFGDFNVENGATGNVCLALSTNAFAQGATLTNNSAPTDFVVELDGTSNGIGEPTFQPGQGQFVQPAFGSRCEPEIQNSEFTFGSFGFPTR